MNIEQRKLQSIYLDYVNNFITVERFAEVYGITTLEAEALINMGGRLHNTLTLKTI